MFFNLVTVYWHCESHIRSNFFFQFFFSFQSSRNLLTFFHIAVMLEESIKKNRDLMTSQSFVLTNQIFPSLQELTMKNIFILGCNQMECSINSDLNRSQDHKIMWRTFQKSLPYFMDMETEAQRVLEICLRSQKLLGACLEFRR